MLSISSGLIASRYTAESKTTNAGHFGHVGLCQLHSFSHVSVRSWQRPAWRNSLASVDWFCYVYVSTYVQFTWYITQATLCILNTDCLPQCRKCETLSSAKVMLLSQKCLDNIWNLLSAKINDHEWQIILGELFECLWKHAVYCTHQPGSRWQKLMNTN